MCSGIGQLLTLIGYSCGFPDIAEADKLNQSYDMPHSGQLAPDKFLCFRVF